MTWWNFGKKEQKPERREPPTRPVVVWEIGKNALSQGHVLSDTVEHMKQGDVILIREALQQVGVWEPVKQILEKSIAQALDPVTLGKLHKVGLGKMHEVLTGEQIVACNGSAHTLFNRWAEDAIPVLVRNAIGYRGVGDYDKNSVIRYFVPAENYKAQKKALGDRPGYTKPQGPHVDTWFGHATAGLNLWMAIEPVRRGNGLAIYPEKWQVDIPHDKKMLPLRDQVYGLPITFDMEPGDLLLFHGEHLHSSELNSTPFTRVVLTTRFSVEKPVILSKETMAKWKPLPPTTPASATTTLAEAGVSSTPEEFRQTYATADGSGTIQPIDEKWIEVTTGGQTHILSRICSHEGADLACGYVQNGRVFCAWHHMNYDPVTGDPACAGLVPLRVQPAEALAGSHA